MQHEHARSSPVGYIQLLRNNRAFRWLWYGQIVSQLGDWFDSIALFALLLRLTGSGTAISILLVAQNLPPAIVGLWAGVVIDRLPRKHIMIMADLGRAALVLLFLFVRSPELIWLVYVVTTLKFVLSTFFEPARSAAIPSIVAEEELIAANAISSITWSAMLAVGAALGGLIVGLLGTSAALVIDSLSFVLSAFFIWRVPLPKRPANTKASSGLEDLREAGRFLYTHGRVALYTFTKGLWSLGGGVLLLLSLYGRELFPRGKDAALSIGLLYAARGLGTAIGPILTQRLGGTSRQFLARAIAPAMVLTGFGYILYGGAPTLELALLAVALAHTGGSTQWTYSTALIQMSVPDRLRGRIFAIDNVALMLATSLSTLAMGQAHDAGVSPRILALIGGIVFITVSAPLWLLWRVPAATLESESSYTTTLEEQAATFDPQVADG